MSLDTVLQIGKTIQKSKDGWKFHRFLKPIEEDIKIYQRKKDATGSTIHTIVYQLPVIGNMFSGFTFDFENIQVLQDEAKIKSLLYLNYKTSDKDAEKKYLFGDIVYSGYKDKDGKIAENGNYRLQLEGAKKPSSFVRCKSEAEDLEDTIIGKFRKCFEDNIEHIEGILRSHSAVGIHFLFEEGKSWIELENVESLLKQKLLDSFIVSAQPNGTSVYALTKTLIKTIKPPIWDKEAKKFNPPDGVGGVTPGFDNQNAYKLRAFSSPDDVWDLMFAIDFAERPMISLGTIGIIALPKGQNLNPDNLIGFLKKSKDVNTEGEQEEILEAQNIANNSGNDLDDLFKPYIENTFDESVQFDIIFIKPKAGSSPAVDIVELSSIKKSHLRKIHEVIRQVRLSFLEEFNQLFPQAKYKPNLSIKESLSKIIAYEGKAAAKKTHFHLLKVLPQIYLDAYYDDPILLPAFVDRTQYNIRNEGQFFYNQFRFHFLFLMNIQKNKPLMEITNSRSYALGKFLGTMAKPFAAWRDDCPIKSFEKNYVGNLTRRIAYVEDLVKFSNFLNEKLAIHEKLYKDQQEASRQLAQELKNLSNTRYNKHECALGFFESYFERLETKVEANQDNN